MAETISKFDPLMGGDSKLGEQDIVFYNTRKDPFRVYGMCNYRTDKIFRRVPEEVAAATSKGVHHLSKQTAGGRVRFSTDSGYVAIRSIMPYVQHMPHMPLTGSTGFDLYIDSDAGSRYYKTFKPDVHIEGGYESIIKFPDRKLRYVTINFPSYNAVDELFIGLQQDAKVAGGAEYRFSRPVVFYGSSITQGACSSRPGLTYENIISRKLDLDYINLGFSGNGKGEDAIVDYMASIDMLAFVSDYDHNAPNVEHLRATHLPMYKKIREAHPDIPYIMISRPDIFSSSYEETSARRDVIEDTFRYARENGDTNAWYIDGEGFFRGPDEDSCTVDNTHPNDLGMMKMADGIGKMLERALRGSDIVKKD